jgi:hypothetical protein
MRTTNPDDEVTAAIFLPTPQVVAHRIDAWSRRREPNPQPAAAARSRGAPPAGREIHGSRLAAGRRCTPRSPPSAPRCSSLPSVPCTAPCASTWRAARRGARTPPRRAGTRAPSPIHPLHPPLCAQSVDPRPALTPVCTPSQRQ